MPSLSKIIKDATVDDVPVDIKYHRRFVPPKVETVVEKVQANPEEQAAGMLEQARHDAETLVQQAQHQAEEIVEAARAESDKIRQEAQQQGYMDGLKAAENEGEKIRQQAQQVLHQAEETRRQTFNEMEQEIINLAVTIAEKYLATQLRLDGNIVVEAAKEALHLVRDREQVTLYVNPEEAAVYLGSKQELEQVLSDRATLSIIMDEQVKPGGCLVQTEQGIVDATVDARWQEVIKAVFPV